MDPEDLGKEGILGLDLFLFIYFLVSSLTSIIFISYWDVLLALSPVRAVWWEL